MSRYTFKCENLEYDKSSNYSVLEEDQTRISSTHTTEFQADSLTTVLKEFELFLRGAGFHFNGQLDIVDDNCEVEKTKEDDELNDESESRQRWASVVHSLGNPPLSRANNCKICGLDVKLMEKHKCYDDNCPVYKPLKTKIRD